MKIDIPDIINLTNVTILLTVDQISENWFMCWSPLPRKKTPVHFCYKTALNLKIGDDKYA